MQEQSEFPFEPEAQFPSRIKIGPKICRWPVKWQLRILLKQALSGEEIPECVLTPIDYDFRPASYWDPENLRQVVANIKGAARKKTALRQIEAGRLDETHESNL